VRASWQTNLCEAPNKLKFTDGNSVYGGYASHCLVPHHKWLIDVEGALPEGLGGVYMCSGLTAFGAIKKVLKGGREMALPQGAGDLCIIGLGGLGFQALSFSQAMLSGMLRVGVNQLIDLD